MALHPCLSYRTFFFFFGRVPRSLPPLVKPCTGASINGTPPQTCRISYFQVRSEFAQRREKKKALMPSFTLLLRVAIGGISPLLKAWKNEGRIMLLAGTSNSFPYFSLFLFLLARITPVGSEKDPPDGARIAMFHF